MANAEQFNNLVEHLSNKDLANCDANCTMLDQVIDDVERGRLLTLAMAFAAGDFRSAEDEAKAREKIRANVFALPLHMGLPRSVTQVRRDVLVQQPDEDQLPAKNFVAKWVGRWRAHLSKCEPREAGDIPQALMMMASLAAEVQADAKHIEALRALAELAETVRALAVGTAINVKAMWLTFLEMWESARKVAQLKRFDDLGMQVTLWKARTTAASLLVGCTLQQQQPRSATRSAEATRARRDRGADDRERSQDGRRDAPRRERSASPARGRHSAPDYRRRDERARSRERDRGRGRGGGQAQHGRPKHDRADQDKTKQPRGACMFYNAGEECNRDCKFVHACSKCLGTPSRRDLSMSEIGHPRYKCPLDAQQRAAEADKM